MHDAADERELLAAMKQRLPELQALLDRASDHWGYEDPVYRFYHQSFKVFGVQRVTKKIVAELDALLPGRLTNRRFLTIIEQGTAREFTDDTNAHWDAETRPVVEAFFHARFMLEMVVKYGRELAEPPEMLPSGWAAILYLYGLR